MSPSGSDISVVIQGPIHGRSNDPLDRQTTRRSLTQLRELWPEAQIIVSTWKGSDTAHLECDELVLSEDPGSISLNDTNLKTYRINLNRQLLSTQNGLARATRPYAIKLRSDCILTQPTNFPLIRDSGRTAAYSVLEAKVIALNLYTRHPLRRPVLFHLSDLFLAGLTSDLRKIWNIPLVDEPAFTRALAAKPPPKVNAYPEADYMFRCAAEQYIAESLARKLCPDLQLAHHSDGSISWLFLWLRLLANNFLLLTPDEAGVSLPHRLARYGSDWDLFQPSDRPWLEKWSRSHVPFSVRLSTAVHYQRVRAALAAPRSLRPLASRLLRHPHARTRERWIDPVSSI